MGLLRDNWKQMGTFRSESLEIKTIETILKRAGAERASDVLTDHHGIYFLDLPGWLPSTNGNWAVLPYAVWNYEQRHPRFDVSGWEAFRADCQRHGVKWLVLSPDAAAWTPFFKAILADASPTHAWVEHIERVNKFEIYRLK
jgi:hypothetical protein